MDIGRDYSIESTGSQPIAAKRDPAVAVGLDRLSKECEVIRGFLSDLEERLRPVLRPNTPNESNCKDMVKESMCPIADRIAESYVSLGDSSRFIVNLIERLEI